MYGAGFSGINFSTPRTTHSDFLEYNVRVIPAIIHSFFMAPTRNRFDPFGSFGEIFARHHLKQLIAAREALGDEATLDIETVDFSYERFKRENATADSECISAFPGPERDRAKRLGKASKKV
jgi:hypothetical protein